MLNQVNHLKKLIIIKLVKHLIWTYGVLTKSQMFVTKSYVKYLIVMYQFKNYFNLYISMVYHIK